jgi:Spy/CpxP family protein refolding chaperone
MKFKIILIFLMISTVTAFASSTPYKGEQRREIKTLSEAEIDSLLNGQGMGFAKAAELNHYPGPKHVLELVDDLDLTHEQISETTSIYNRMKIEAVQLGKELVDGEAKLNKLFENSTITYENLDNQLSAIETTRAQLRGAHLEAHLAQRLVLTPHQLHQYDKLRGYSKGKKDHSHSGEFHN